MGIPKLWPEFAGMMEESNFSAFRDHKVGIDMFVLLHKCLLAPLAVRRANAKRLSAAQGGEAVDDAEVFADLVCRRLDTLLRHGVVPVCVFDGPPPPMKKETLEKRAKAGGASKDDEADGGMSRIPHNWVRAITQRLQQRKVECIQAPCEADAQLAYLCRIGYIDVVLSVDSDLIVYFCPCLIKDYYKDTDWQSGACKVVRPRRCAPAVCRAIAGGGGRESGTDIVDAAEKKRAAGMRDSILREVYSVDAAPGRLDFGDAAIAEDGLFTYEAFLLSCVMSGSDYAANIPSVGIKRAFQLVRQASSIDDLFAKIEKMKKVKEGELGVHRRRLLDAFYCFAHHLVYCPLLKEVLPFHPLPILTDSRGQSATAPLKTEVVGVRWDAQTARDVCERLAKSPYSVSPLPFWLIASASLLPSCGASACAAAAAVFAAPPPPPPPLSHACWHTRRRSVTIKYHHHHHHHHATQRVGANAPAASSARASGTASSRAPQSRLLSPVASLVAMNQVQRMLRRLPIGRSSGLFHYNELPSNVQSRVPPAALQHLRERTGSESTASATVPSASAASAGDDKDGAPLSHLLRLQEPHLSPSLSTLFALYRRATKERQLLLRRSQIPSGAADEAGATRLEYLRQLEEPALLLPDTRNASAALGLSTARAAVQHGASAEPVEGGAVSSADAQLDAFYVGVVTEATDYRVDYAATPEHYVLGLPTDLLRLTSRTTAATVDGAMSCPRRFPVELSAWVVYDDASGQFLLRRGRASANDGAASTSYRAVLEEEVFLAHTYHFDPKRAYDAALAVHRRHTSQKAEGESGPSRPPSCGYALFFFHSSRGGERTFCGAAQNAGVLYPSCYFSYLAEVPTTRMLAAEHRSSAHVPVGGAAVPLSSTPSQRRQERATEGPAQSTASPLFLAVSGKRYHAAAAPREGAETPAAATSWTVQTDVRRPQPAAPPLSTGTAHSSDGQAEEGEAASGQVLRAQLRAAFREWGAAAAARAGALPLTSPPRVDGGGSVGAVASTGTLEARLDAERTALLPSRASAWQQGWRLTAASIAVAMPIICDTTMALRPADEPSSHHRERRQTVADAPLADALWNALYTPEGQLAPSSASAGAPAAPCPSAPLTRPPFRCGGGAVLPLAEDRLSAARQRVLLPFLRAPRRVAPSGRGDCGCCPALWHVDEIEAVCGWRTFPEHFLKAFGCFSGLFHDDLYVPLGTRASPYCFSDGSGGDVAAPAWQSPVVWINDAVYVHRVLVPALMFFARHTTALEKGTLCVYRGVNGAGLAGTMDTAVAVGTHHRQLGMMLQQLQQMPTPELQAWLAAAPNSSLADAEVQRRCGASENCLAFFRGAAVRAVTGKEPRRDILAGLGGSEEIPASELVAALRALTVADINVVPLLDFLTWASLSSDFSSKALDALRLHAG